MPVFFDLILSCCSILQSNIPVRKLSRKLTNCPMKTTTEFSLTPMLNQASGTRCQRELVGHSLLVVGNETTPVVLFLINFLSEAGVLRIRKIPGASVLYIGDAHDLFTDISFPGMLTLNFYNRNIYDKLHVHGRAQLMNRYKGVF